MSITIELPKGFTAVLRDTEDLSNKDVKQVRRVARKASAALQKLRDGGLIGDDEAPEDETEDQKRQRNQKALTAFAALTDDEEDDLDLYQRECLVLRLESWTLTRPDGSEWPLPKTVDEVDALPRYIYEPLTKKAADLNLNENFDRDSGIDDPKVPTES